MGNETKTTVFYDGALHDAKILLETEEVIARGGLKLRVPFREVREALAVGNDLILRWGEHELRVPLVGADAEKWASKIRNPKSRVDKLGVKAGQKISALGSLDRELLDELTASGADVSRRARRNSDIIFIAIDTRDELASLRELRDSLHPTGALWVVRPKGSAAISENEVMQAGRAAGLVDVKVVRLTASHTAEKFVIPLTRRR